MSNYSNWHLLALGAPPVAVPEGWRTATKMARVADWGREGHGAMDRHIRRMEDKLADETTSEDEADDIRRELAVIRAKEAGTY